MRLYRFFSCGVAIVLLASLLGCHSQESRRSSSFITKWSVQPSLVYDTCHLIGILTGRQIYSKYYSQVYRDWSWNLPPPVRGALAQIDQILGPNLPPGPRLSMLLANTPPAGSLAEMMGFVRDDARVRAQLMASDYGTEQNWRQWLALKAPLLAVLEYLQANQFEDYWRNKFLPELIAKSTVMKQELQAYDVAGDIERFLGDYRCASDTLELYVLFLGAPHELRLRRQARATDVQLPLSPVIRNFYREMLHPYCDGLVDSLLAPEFAQLPADDFLQACVQKLAFNGVPLDFSSFSKKELVLAAEVWLAARRQLLAQSSRPLIELGGQAIREYLRQQNAGAHGLGVTIYSYLEAGLKPERITYADFVKDLFASGKLRAGKIASRYHDFFNMPGLAQE